MKEKTEAGKRRKDRTRKKKKRQEPAKTGARKGRKDRSQQRQRPAVKATFRLTAIFFIFLDHFSDKIPLAGTNATVHVS